MSPTEMDLFNLWRSEVQALRVHIDKRFTEIRWLIGVGFAVIGVGFALLIVIATFIR